MNIRNYFDCYRLKDYSSSDKYAVKRLLSNRVTKKDVILDRCKEAIEDYVSYPAYDKLDATPKKYMRHIKNNKPGDIKPGEPFSINYSDNECMEFYGDLMNGALLIVSYIESIEINNDNAEGLDIIISEWEGASSVNQKWKLLYSLLYEKKVIDEDCFINLLGKVALEYMKSISTIGNYMPCPEGYNLRPGRGGASDTMDIKIQRYREWYNGSIDENPWKKVFPTWKSFVDANFLTMYCDKMYNPLNATQDRKSWTSKDWTCFFEKTTSKIIERGEIIMQAISKS